MISYHFPKENVVILEANKWSGRPQQMVDDRNKISQLVHTGCHGSTRANNNNKVKVP